MTFFSHLVRFESAEDGNIYLADLGPNANGPPATGTEIEAFTSIDELASREGAHKVTISRLLAPLPRVDIPIYCVGLNYRSHAEEANLKVSAYPPLWTKPAAAIAHPGEDIPVNKLCARSSLDYEGELVFVTSKDCKDVSPEEAKSFILGYTVGNDLSCRFFQLPENSAGQYFFAKGFDKFAPIGPTLISTHIFDQGRPQMVTRVNGQVRQTADLRADMVFSPEEILCHMSQGTTIPAGTAVMTGTAAGVGAFMSPKTFLQDGDVVEIEMGKVGILKNKISFE